MKLVREGCDDSKQCHIEESSLEYLEAIVRDTEVCLEDNIQSATLEVNFKKEDERASAGKWYLKSGNNLLKSYSKEGAFSISLRDSSSTAFDKDQKCLEEAKSLNNSELSSLIEKKEIELAVALKEKATRLEDYLVKQDLKLKKAHSIRATIFEAEKYYAIFRLFFSEKQVFKLNGEWRKFSFLFLEQENKARDAAKELEMAEVELSDLFYLGKRRMREYLRELYSVDFDLVDTYSKYPDNISRKNHRRKLKDRIKHVKHERERQQIFGLDSLDHWRLTTPYYLSFYLIDPEKMDRAPPRESLRDNTDLDLLSKELNEKVKMHLEEIDFLFSVDIGQEIERLIHAEHIQKEDVKKLFKGKTVKDEDLEDLTQLLQFNITKKSEISNLSGKEKTVDSHNNEEQLLSIVPSLPKLSEEDRAMYEVMMDPLDVEQIKEQKG